MGVKITVTVPDACAEVLDALAFYYDFGGVSPRATLLRDTMIDFAERQYERSADVREIVDSQRAAQLRSAARHPACHLRLVQ